MGCGGPPPCPAPAPPRPAAALPPAAPPTAPNCTSPSAFEAHLVEGLVGNGRDLGLPVQSHRLVYQNLVLRALRERLSEGSLLGFVSSRHQANKCLER